MNHPLFTKEDERQIRGCGLTPAEVERQLEMLRRPRSFFKLKAPCTVGDGIRAFDPARQDALASLYEREGMGFRCVKFVPASGAASRMFQAPLHYFHRKGEILRSEVAREAAAGNRDAARFLVFADGLKLLPFYRELTCVMAKNGFDADALIEQGRFRDILRFLLTDDGLGYANLPKGLLPFHTYPTGSRTAFEEHLVEAAFYVRGSDGRCRVSFTVSEAHMDRFRACLRRVQGTYEREFGVRYDVTFSVQDPSTDTLAVDLNDIPFRLKDGRLLFRPGGHGSLLKNLGEIDAEVVFIKNIDNVAPDHLKPEIFRWKKILAGYLIEVQRPVFAFMERLAQGDQTASLLDEVGAFLEEELLIRLPGNMKEMSHEERRRLLAERLNRPIRVCGMVKNVGEPGGAPFWVEDGPGERSPQIVETVHIDFEARDQREIFEASTHFNPVDLVCGVKDWQGERFDLRRFVDPQAVCIARKSKDGRELKALEHPGLWNGSMSRWITLFVDVPEITFNPVKSVNDLLRKAHQPVRQLGYERNDGARESTI